MGRTKTFLAEGKERNDTARRAALCLAGKALMMKVIPSARKFPSRKFPNNSTWKSIPICNGYLTLLYCAPLDYLLAMPVCVQANIVPTSRLSRLFLLLWGGIDLVQAADRGYLLSSPPLTSYCLGYEL